MSGGSEWQQDCLACLLKLLCQLGMTQAQDAAAAKNKRKRCAKTDKMTIPRLSQVISHLSNTQLLIVISNLFGKKCMEFSVFLTRLKF